MIKVTDLTNQEAFPNTKYRFSKVTLENDDAVVLERDFIGENPLHYYLDPKLQEVIVASSIREINGYLKSKGSKFLWEHVRAVSNNKKVTITSNTFYTANPSIIELGPTLQEMPEPTVDVSNIPAAGGYIKNLFVQSIKDRLQTINDTTVGLLLSGGLENITEIVKKALTIAENPKRDNLFCSLAMYLIGQAVKNEGVKIVFCGEGPNEMIND